MWDLFEPARTDGFGTAAVGLVARGPASAAVDEAVGHPLWPFEARKSTLDDVSDDDAEGGFDDTGVDDPDDEFDDVEDLEEEDDEDEEDDDDLDDDEDDLDDDEDDLDDDELDDEEELDDAAADDEDA